jgi:hypothetical protein
MGHRHLTKTAQKKAPARARRQDFDREFREHLTELARLADLTSRRKSWRAPWCCIRTPIGAPYGRASSVRRPGCKPWAAAGFKDTE